MSAHPPLGWAPAEVDGVMMALLAEFEARDREPLDSALDAVPGAIPAPAADLAAVGNRAIAAAGGNMLRALSGNSVPNGDLLEAAPAAETETGEPVAPAGHDTAPTQGADSAPAGGGDGAGAPDTGAETDATVADGTTADTETVDAAEAPPAGPEDDPAFTSLEMSLRDTGTAERSHMGSGAAAGSAQAAAMSPPDERASLASAGRAAATESTDTPPFDVGGFVNKVMAKVEAAAPRRMSEARDFTGSGKLDAMKGDLRETTEEQAAESTGPLEAANQTPPDPSSVPEREPRPLEEQQPGPAPTAPPADAVAPPPQPDAAVVGENEELSADLDRRLAMEGITEESLETSNEPTFLTALGEKRAAQARAAAAPAEFRTEEAALASAARAEGQAAIESSLAEMHDVRTESLEQVTGSQQQTITADEGKRAQITADIAAIYESTRARVEARLAQLDTEVDAAFSTGIDDAKRAFERHYEQAMDDRYSGLRGKARWVADKVFGGLVGPVERILRRAQTLFLERMNVAVANVAAIVGRGLTEAKEIVAEGREDIQAYVDALPADLQAIGNEAAAAIEERFTALETSIDDKENQLVESISSRYSQAMDEIGERMEQIREASKSWLERARDMVVGIIEAIRSLKDLLLNVLASIGDAVTNILRDPIGFLGNLVSGALQGLNDFVSGIVEHLRNALMDWLFGELASAGIQFPPRLDAEGIFSIIAQIFGLTYQAIRARAVAIVGEPIVARLEQFAEPIVALIQGGPAALWEWLEEKVSSIADTVLEGIKEFVIERVIKAGITWIIGLLNPAAAFIKAAKAIYDIVMFFVERGRQVIELVQAFIAGVGEVARGNVSGIASKVKDALVRALPLVISFLARLLGLGGISQKIREILDRVRAPVDQAIDWLINKAVDIVRAAGRLFGLGEEEEAAEEDGSLDLSNDSGHDDAVETGLIDLRAEVVSLGADGGMATQTEAQAVAEKVRASHRVFTQLAVTGEGRTWDFSWAASPGGVVPGPNKEEDSAQEVDIGAIADELIEMWEVDRLEDLAGESGDIATMQRHGSAGTARRYLGIEQGTHESAHISPQAAMRELPQYDAREMLTLLLPKDVHRRLDNHWKAGFRAMAASGATTLTAQQLYETVAAAINASPDFTAGEKATLVAHLSDEIFLQMGLSSGDLVRLPYS
jgi:hypothetical protein